MFPFIGKFNSDIVLLHLPRLINVSRQVKRKISVENNVPLEQREYLTLQQKLDSFFVLIPV